jgi:chorismate mutase/prephenate dehydratase
VRNRADAPLRIAYQGVEGSFSHIAAQRRYAGRAGGALLSGFDSFRAAAEAVTTGTADLALLPIENTTAGSINETYDLLAGGSLHITGEVVSAIEHCLLALPGVAIGDLRTVISHPQALAQCQELFLKQPHLTARADFDTAGAARRVVEANDRTLGAIASAAAAQRYGLTVIARGIQSTIGNSTRFVEVALRPAPVPEGAITKTSLIFALADRPGVLGEILTRLAARNLSLTKLESRPIPEVPFTYRFYADVLGHTASEPFHAALEDIRPLTTDLRILGTYPSAV